MSSLNTSDWPALGTQYFQGRNSNDLGLSLPRLPTFTLIIIPEMSSIRVLLDIKLSGTQISA